MCDILEDHKNENKVMHHQSKGEFMMILVENKSEN